MNPQASFLTSTTVVPAALHIGKLKFLALFLYQTRGGEEGERSKTRFICFTLKMQSERLSTKNLWT